MATGVFTQEFAHEFEAERGRWLRKRFLWYAAVVIGSTNTGRISSAGSETTLQRTQRQVQFALKLIF